MNESKKKCNPEKLKVVLVVKLLYDISSRLKDSLYKHKTKKLSTSDLQAHTYKSTQSIIMVNDTSNLSFVRGDFRLLSNKLKVSFLDKTFERKLVVNVIDCISEMCSNLKKEYSLEEDKELYI